MSALRAPDERSIAALVAARQPQARDVRVERLVALPGGNARRAWSFDVGWTDEHGAHVEPCVLLGRMQASQLDVDGRREYETLCALASTSVPSPRPLWFDEDGATLGVPGMITRRGEGRTAIVGLLAPESTATRPLTTQLMRIAAQLHALDWQSILPATPTPADAAEPTRVELVHWEQQFLRNRMEPMPALASVFGWLRRNVPVPPRLAVVHGDFRLGNFLHHEGRITLLLDWEMTHVGDPLEDIAWAYRDVWSPYRHLSLDDAVAVYEAASGSRVDPAQLAWWRVFSEAKFSVISLNAARIFIDGKTDHLPLAGRASGIARCVQQALQWIDALEAA